MDNCPGCGTEPGQKHKSDWCDVARCKQCGKQLISCYVHQHAELTTWTGLWPGILECREYDYAVYDFPGCPGWTEDLNKLSRQAAKGKLVWSSHHERYFKVKERSRYGSN